MSTPTTVNGIDELKALIGQQIGPSEWREVTQEDIDKFADVSGDHQWIHVDVERAKKEMPGGKTIAHGYLTLSLLPQLAPTLMKIEKRRRGLNYGSNRVRFTAPVPAGARVRLRQKLVKVEPVEDNGFRITSEMTMEVEGNARPAMVAETLGIVYG
jgi:acyl dehydratase